MTDILDRLFDRNYDLEETLHDAHGEIEQLRAMVASDDHTIKPHGIIQHPMSCRIDKCWVLVERREVEAMRVALSEVALLTQHWRADDD